MTLTKLEENTIRFFDDNKIPFTKFRGNVIFTDWFPIKNERHRNIFSKSPHFQVHGMQFRRQHVLKNIKQKTDE